MNPKKRVNPNQQQQQQQTDPQQKLKKMKAIYSMLIQVSTGNLQHPFDPLLRKMQQKKHPILPTLTPSADVYKISNDKKKKPIQFYLDSISTIYKKKDLDILINPVTYTNVFENWAPREVAIFQQAILKFGKQFQFIAELIGTKNCKQVYEFYLEWKTTSHFRSFKIAMNAANRSSSLEQWV